MRKVSLLLIYKLTVAPEINVMFLGSKRWYQKWLDLLLLPNIIPISFAALHHISFSSIQQQKMITNLI